jgi:hypothetical protein
MNFYELFIFHIFVFSYLLIFLMGGTAPVLAGAPRSRSLSCYKKKKKKHDTQKTSFSNDVDPTLLNSECSCNVM